MHEKKESMNVVGEARGIFLFEGENPVENKADLSCEEMLIELLKKSLFELWSKSVFFILFNHQNWYNLNIIFIFNLYI